jgi:hypothetical protein
MSCSTKGRLSGSTEGRLDDLRKSGELVAHGSTIGHLLWLYQRALRAGSMGSLFCVSAGSRTGIPASGNRQAGDSRMVPSIGNWAQDIPRKAHTKRLPGFSGGSKPASIYPSIIKTRNREPAHGSATVATGGFGGATNDWRHRSPDGFGGAPVVATLAPHP